MNTLVVPLPGAVIFDMDGVLVDSEPVHAESYCRAFAEIGMQVTREQYRQAIVLGQSTVSELYLSLGGNIEHWKQISKRKAEITRDLFNAQGTLMPGIVELLEAIKSADIPTALATSAGRGSLEVIMGKFDLKPYFWHIVTWEDVSTIKPDPMCFILAAEKLSVPREHCVVFEDTPRGVLAAHRAGMKCIAIPNASTLGGDFSVATLVVESLETVTMETIRGLFRDQIP